MGARATTGGAARRRAQVPRAIATAIAITIGAACAGPVAGPITVEALVPDPAAEGGFALGDVVLEQVLDIRAGTGRRFDVRPGLNFYGTPTSDRAALDAMSPDDLAEASRADGRDASGLDIAWDGARWVARDFEALEYLTILATIEAAFAFLDDKGSETTATTTKAPVSFFGVTLAAPELPIPLVTSDNAAFVPAADMLFVVPTLLVPSGVPYFMDATVAVHELHHRVFQHRVLRGDAYEAWKRFAFPAVYKDVDLQGDVVAELYTERERLTFTQLAGVNEGLADVAAAAFAGRPDFAAVLGEAELAARDLEGTMGGATTLNELLAGDLPADVANRCAAPEGGDPRLSLSWNFYCLGTLVAGTLWSVVDGDAARFAGEILPLVEDALDDLGPKIAAASTDGELVFDVDMLLLSLAENADAALLPALCERLRARFGAAADGACPP